VLYMRTAYSVLVEILKERHHLGDVGMDECAIVKWLLNQLCGDCHHLSKSTIQ
jgi:hypothetical protein